MVFDPDPDPGPLYCSPAAGQAPSGAGPRPVCHYTVTLLRILLSPRPEKRVTITLPGDSLQPHISQAGEHQRLAYTGGHELAVILDAAITGGQLTVIDVHARRGDAPPVHIHSRDEAFLLLDGAMTVWVSDQRHQLQPVGIAFLPRSLPHAVRYEIASRARILSTPAGPQESIFRSAGWDLS